MKRNYRHEVILLGDFNIRYEKRNESGYKFLKEIERDTENSSSKAHIVNEILMFKKWFRIHNFWKTKRIIVLLIGLETAFYFKNNLLMCLLSLERRAKYCESRSASCCLSLIHN